MSLSDYLFLFSGMSFVTYLPRALPLLYLAHKQLPQWLIDWLSLIPVAILSALLDSPRWVRGNPSRTVAAEADVPGVCSRIAEKDPA